MVRSVVPRLSSGWWGDVPVICGLIKLASAESRAQ